MLADSQQSPLVRWALAPILDEFPESADSLKSLMRRSDVDEWAVRGAAAVLGHLYEPAARPVLREAMEALASNRCNGLWILRAGAAVPRVVSALATLGDEAWAEPHLQPLLADHLHVGPPGSDGRRVDALLAALQHIDLSGTADVVRRYIREVVAAPTTRAARHMYSVTRMAHSGLVPHVIELLDRNAPVRFGFPDRAMRIIGATAHDVTPMPWLLEFYRLGDDAGEAIDALKALAQRCQVRIFEDGRIIDIKGLDVKNSASGR